MRTDGNPEPRSGSLKMQHKGDVSRRMCLMGETQRFILHTIPVLKGLEEQEEEQLLPELPVLLR